MTNSRAKGARGELEFSAFLRSHGIDARRGQQYAGGHDSPDVVTALQGIHFEVKRAERFRLYDSLEQAKRDAGPDRLPVVAHRQNGKPWAIILDASDFLRLVGGSHHG